MALLHVVQRIRRRLLLELLDLDPVPEPPLPRTRGPATRPSTDGADGADGADVALRVLSLNAWGLPVAPQVMERATEIARAIETGGFDVVVLQEIWHRRERNLIISRAARAGLAFYHYFSSAIGFPVPLGHDSFGTGLLVLSRFPLESVLYHSFALSGRPYALHEADFVANKGVGLVRVQTPAGQVDLYVTHLIANYNALGAPGPGDAYLPHRTGQSYELARFIEATNRNALTIVCGDLNSPPDSIELRLPKAMLQLRDAFTDTNNHTGFTFATEDNKYSFGEHPMRMDYVLYKALKQPATHQAVWQLVTSDIFKGFFTDENGEKTPLSDHFGVTAEFVFGARRPHSCELQASTVVQDCPTTTCVHCDEVEGTKHLANSSSQSVQVLEEAQAVILQGRDLAIARRAGHLRRSALCFIAVQLVVVARMLMLLELSWCTIAVLLLVIAGVCEYILAFFFDTLECSTFTELANQVRLHLQVEHASAECIPTERSNARTSSQSQLEEPQLQDSPDREHRRPTSHRRRSISPPPPF